MKVLLFTVLAVFVLLTPPQARAEVDGCFGEVTPRRIEACSALIDTPGVDSARLSMAYAMRALAFSLREQYSVAIRDYDAALALNPDFAVALNNRAWAYFKMGQPARGLPDVERALTLDPSSAHSFDTRAHIKQWLGQPTAALSDYQRAMQFGDQRIIKLYQCGLQNHGLYGGGIDGRWSPELSKAMAICVQSTTCDPLPPDEDCRAATS